MKNNLIQEITNCTHFCNLSKKESNENCCSKIVDFQKNKKIEIQLPEPFSGDLHNAPILFISSNPSLSREEIYPTESWPKKMIIDFFVNRFENRGENTSWVFNNKCLNKNGRSIKSVKYWASINKRAEEILERKDKMGFLTAEPIWMKSNFVLEFRKMLLDSAVLLKDFISLNQILNDFDEMVKNKSNFKKSNNQNQSSRAESRGDFYADDDEDKPKPTQIDRLELFLSTRYVFRHNMVSGKLEFQYFGKKKWNVMNDFIENSMLRECLKGRIKTNLSSLRNLLYSDFCELFNPFEDYFFNLPTYDEKTDYITELANTITTTKQDLWQQCFKKWLVAMVGCVLDDKVINHTVIVFSGKQGLGKTTWVEKLVPKQLKEYLFSGTINPNNKDTLVQLAECMLINLDELENLNRSEIGSLKEIITKTQIRMRKAYGHNNETMPRRASFAGSVNTAQFLNDSTGSRRFLCFELEGIKYQHDVDINMAFSQALFLFKSGFRFWFDQEEIKNITANNEQYQLHSPEEELLLTWFEPCERGKANVFLNASQIAAKLAEKAKINITDGTVNKLGKALKKHNFIRFNTKNGYVYALNEFSYEEVDNKNKELKE